MSESKSFTDYLVKVTPNDKTSSRLSFVMLVVILIYVIFRFVIDLKLKIRRDGMTDVEKSIYVMSGAPGLRMASERGDAVGTSSFTGGHSPDTPAFYESTAERVDYNTGAGLTSKTHNAFAETSWSYVEMAVYPKLTAQLQAKYFNASTSEKLSILSGAAAALGVTLPTSLPTTTNVAGFTSKISTLANKDDELAKKLGH